MEFRYSSHRLATPPPPRRPAHSTSHSLVDRHPSPLEEHGPYSRFPTSSDRLGWPTRFPPESILDSSTRTRYDPLGSLAQDDCALARKALFTSFVPRFFPSSIARGVLSDGTWTTEHPSVHTFLQSPTSRPSLSSRTSAAIYALASLHVFYSPSHPSYEAFWHPSIKESTAIFVHQVISTYTDLLPCNITALTCVLLPPPSAMDPSPISTAPMTWLGVHDMLWQLTGIQKEYFRTQGVKPSPPPLLPTRRSLRKRKPVQTLLQELGTREPSEAPEAPPRKKIKTTESGENEKESEATSPVALDQPDISTEDKAGPSKSTISSPVEMRGNPDATPSPLTISSSLPPESHPPTKDDVTQTGTSRGRAKDAAGKKATQANSGPSRSSARRIRERSPSFSSGSSTAVSAAGSNPKRARSSSSASSTSTTVDATETRAHASGKDKGKEKAIGEETDEGEEDDEDEDHEVVKRPTRTRRSTAAAREVVPKTSRKPGATTGSRSHAEVDELAAAAEAPPRRVRNRSGVTSSRSRKSRKS
jgi:hypothetical protein